MVGGCGPGRARAPPPSLRSGTLRSSVARRRADWDGKRSAGSGGVSAFVEVAAPKQTWFVQEPVEIVLRVGVDAAWFRANVIQTSRVQLDLPVEVSAPPPPGLARSRGNSPRP